VLKARNERQGRMSRFIGIRHRIKQTAEGEAHPTQVVIIDGGQMQQLELPDDTAELDFVRGEYPIEWRNVESGEDIGRYRPHHVKLGRGDKPDKVPAKMVGLQAGDMVAMMLGGSGDRFAAALSRRGDDIGAQVYRIPPAVFKFQRGELGKDEDAQVMAILLMGQPELFHYTGPRERDVIRVKTLLMARQDAMKARIACEQRLHQRVIGQCFLTEDGFYAEGTVEDAYQAAKANSAILKSLMTEEAQATRELQKVVRSLDVWTKIFEPITGVGEVLAAGLISAIGDVRRFKVEPDYTGATSEDERQYRRMQARNKSRAKLKAFCGVHVMDDGRFPRRRAGQVANWNPDARQALYQIVEQFNRRPDSEWGIRLREIKARLQETHPEPEVTPDGKKRWTPAHIHRTALWRTATRFVERLYSEWYRLEVEARAETDDEAAVS